jgi:hypothetical protein
MKLLAVDAHGDVRGSGVVVPYLVNVSRPERVPRNPLQTYRGARQRLVCQGMAFKNEQQIAKSINQATHLPLAAQIRRKELRIHRPSHALARKP